jgi:hypothetical protein
MITTTAYATIPGTSARRIARRLGLWHQAVEGGVRVRAQDAPAVMAFICAARTEVLRRHLAEYVRPCHRADRWRNIPTDDGQQWRIYSDYLRDQGYAEVIVRIALAVAEVIEARQREVVLA